MTRRAVSRVMIASDAIAAYFEALDVYLGEYIAID